MNKEIAELCERLEYSFAHASTRTPALVREAAAALARLDIAIDAAKATEEALYNRIVVERDRAEKAEAALAEAQRETAGERAIADGWHKRWKAAEAALAVEQAQVLAALQERDDLAVALAEAKRWVDCQT